MTTQADIDKKHLVMLFAYGKLKPAYAPPATMRGWIHDSVKGDLYALPRDAAAINVGKSKNWMLGYTMMLDERELEQIDKEEMPEYHRVKTISYAGFEVWVYEYGKQLPKDAKQVRNWNERSRLKLHRGED